MPLQQFFIDGLDCASYLAGCESAGIAALIDPDRDVQKYLDIAVCTSSAKADCIMFDDRNSIIERVNPKHHVGYTL